MNKAIRAAAAVLAPLALVGLAACSSGSDGESGHGTHDHSSHGAMEDTAADSTDSATPGDVATVAVPALTKIEPSADYPLTTCVVSGDSLDAMGGPMAFTYEGQEVQFCCKGCIAEFKESPEEFLAKVRAAGK